MSELEELDPRVGWIVTELRQPVGLEPQAKQRLLAALRAEPIPTRIAPRHRAWEWVRRPMVAFSPLAGAAMAAGLVGIGVLGGFLLRSSRPATNAPSNQMASRVTGSAGGELVANRQDRVVVQPSAGGEVKFVLVAPQADRVALVGDFNQWNPVATPLSRTGGTWSVSLPLRPGLHVYAFVVNGTHWMPDPSAPLAPEDDYGRSNSVVLVGGSRS